MTETPLSNSTYLDMTGYDLSSGTDVLTAYTGSSDTSGVSAADRNVVVALTLNRANDPTELLSEDWADRQKTIAQMTANGTLWTTYGADSAAYAATQAALSAMGLSTLPASEGYVSSAASRTIWLSLTPAQFSTLFGTRLLQDDNVSSTYWNGDLSLPSSIAGAVSGLWIETGSNDPQPATETTGSITLDQGAQSIGDSGDHRTALSPNAVAAGYDAPLSTSSTLTTPAIALIEPRTSDGETDGTDFQTDLDAYRAEAGIAAPGTYYTVGDSPGAAGAPDSGERSLDVGIVTTVAPNSRLGLYGGGDDATDRGTFSSDMEAVWDTANAPADISSSFSDDSSASPDSPFYRAYNALWEDAALRNISVFFSVGDGGSQEKLGSGTPMTDQSHSSQYAIVTGGVSQSSFARAANDPTLADLLSEADQLDRATLRMLMAGGLDVLPTVGSRDAAATFVETVWNDYFVQGDTIGSNKGGAFDDNGGFDSNNAAAGGIDTTQATPSYQTAYGLDPTSTGPDAQTGRGVPDVSSVAGGDLHFTVPEADMTGTHPDSGTSAAAPFWAALTAQFQAIFADQGLPTTGYFNDLLYQAAAVAPASFNDVQLGNNDSTYVEDGDGPYELADGTPVTITGSGDSPYGYSAGPGYDLTTGLGTPNGLLLARALTAIAHAEMYSPAPPLLDSDDTFATGGAVLVQPHVVTAGTISVDGATFAATPPGEFAWSNQLAGQSLQAGYDPNLLTIFDTDTQGTPGEISVSAGQALSVTVDGSPTTLPQEADTSPFGFVEATDAAGDDVTLARPLMVAQTAMGADDQNAVLRIRENGADQTSMTFYRVDDYTGDIDGIAPGQDGYAAAAFARAYSTIADMTSIADPADGQMTQTELTGVNAGDLIAAELTDGAHQYWGFSNQNEQVDGSAVTHLWNYGLNTFGFEDLYGGGDRDFNDTVFQLDFTSASGHGLLV